MTLDDLLTQLQALPASARHAQVDLLVPTPTDPEVDEYPSFCLGAITYEHGVVNINLETEE
jgi:hypothetical protein